jgi:ATP-dependent DNA helicase RecG
MPAKANLNSPKGGEMAVLSESENSILQKPLAEIVKIRPQTARLLPALGIHTVAEALLYFPYRHEDFSKIVKIADLIPGERVSVKATIKQIKKTGGFAKIMPRAEAVVSDDTGSIKIVWFRQPYLATQLKAGDELYLAGKPEIYKGLQMANPLYEKVFGENAFDTSGQAQTARIVPVYSLGVGISLRTFRNILFAVLPYAEQFKEILPLEIVQSENLMPRSAAIRELHFPTSEEELGKARRRMAYEEIFLLQSAVEMRKLNMAKAKTVSIPFKQTLIRGFLKKLPFELTVEQKKAAWQIFQDLAGGKPMNRLLEGDVGSGKTLVAFATALGVLAAGYQVALLCPTEILAEQHYQNALKYFAEYPKFGIILLTSKKQYINGARETIGAKGAKKLIIEEIAHGGPQLIIGTHAALQKQVIFANLAYLIIDEQHRFGVRQRAELPQRQPNDAQDNKKGSHIKAATPHLLSMTATPIPRTLQLALYGDLDISRILHKPAGRKTVITKLVAPDDRARAYQSIAKQIADGRQAFVVTPLIDPSEIDDESTEYLPIKPGSMRERNRDAKSATTEAEALKKIFPKLHIGLLHGRMKSEEKEKVMADFLAGKINILVSTTVIEVGVDVPNASVMVIENAERFGLAQLHQLRGRVGRAEHQSFCLLFAGTSQASALSRLKKMETMSSGFELAELDLKIRGAGNLFGTQQSGLPNFAFYDVADSSMAVRAREAARELIAGDPQLLQFPELRGDIKNKLIHFE